MAQAVDLLTPIWQLTRHLPPAAMAAQMKSAAHPKNGSKLHSGVSHSGKPRYVMPEPS